MAALSVGLRSSCAPAKSAIASVSCNDLSSVSSSSRRDSAGSEAEGCGGKTGGSYGLWYAAAGEASVERRASMENTGSGVQAVYGVESMDSGDKRLIAGDGMTFIAGDAWYATYG